MIPAELSKLSLEETLKVTSCHLVWNLLWILGNLNQDLSGHEGVEVSRLCVTVCAPHKYLWFGYIICTNSGGIMVIMYIPYNTVTWKKLEGNPEHEILSLYLVKQAGLYTRLHLEADREKYWFSSFSFCICMKQLLKSTSILQFSPATGLLLPVFG